MGGNVKSIRARPLLPFVSSRRGIGDFTKESPYLKVDAVLFKQIPLAGSFFYGIAEGKDRVGMTVKTAQTRMNTGFLTCHFAL